MNSKEKIKELIQKQLKEINATGTGASFDSNLSGENYAPVVSKAKNYYYKLSGFKPVDRKKLNKDTHGVIVKQLWTEETEPRFDIEGFVNSLGVDDETKHYIAGRLGDFNLIADRLKKLIKLIQDAKKETINSYRESPEQSSVYDTDIAVEAIDRVIKLFT